MAYLNSGFLKCFSLFLDLLQLLRLVEKEISGAKKTECLYNQLIFIEIISESLDIRILLSEFIGTEINFIEGDKIVEKKNCC